MRVEMRQRIAITLRSGAVGAVATATDLLALGALVELAGWSPRVASVPALVLGLVAQFVGNKWLAFEDRSRAWARQGALFLLVELGALGLNAVLFDRAVALGAPWPIARVVVQMVVYFGFSLPLWSRIFSPGAVGGRS